MDFSLIIDALIAVLLVATIAYAAVLNRKLGALRDAKSEMAALIASLSESTERAGSGIETLKQAAGHSGEVLQNKVEAARGLVDDLGFLIERGTRLAERLDGGARGAGPKPASGPAAEPDLAPRLQAERPVAGEDAPGNTPDDARVDALEEAVPVADSAPQAAAADLTAAESELLKALQGMR